MKQRMSMPGWPRSDAERDGLNPLTRVRDVEPSYGHVRNEEGGFSSWSLPERATPYATSQQKTVDMRFGLPNRKRDGMDTLPETSR